MIWRSIIRINGGKTLLRKSLSSKQIRKLRSLGMTEEAVVMIGKEGVSPAVVASAREAIKKTRADQGARSSRMHRRNRRTRLPCLPSAPTPNLVQVIGRNGLLFKRNFDKPRIEL